MPIIHRFASISSLTKVLSSRITLKQIMPVAHISLIYPNDKSEDLPSHLLGQSHEL